MRVPTHPEVVPVDRSFRDEARADFGSLIDAILPPGRAPLTKIAHVQVCLLRDTSNRQVAPEQQVVLTNRINLSADKGDRGKFLDIEEIRASQVRVAVGFAGPETLCIDHRLNSRLS